MAIRYQKPINYPIAKAALEQKIRSHSLVITILSVALLLAGCQPTTDAASEQGVQDEQVQPLDTKVIKAGTMSDSAAATIEEYQPLYVEQMIGLQQRLQAEYEALKSADTSDTSTPNTSSNNQPLDSAEALTTVNNANTSQDAVSLNNSAPLNDNSVTANPNTAVPLDPNAEVGERDLEVLKRISFEPRAPEILSEAQIAQRYQQAMQALYRPDKLSADESETLLSVAELLPQLFEHPQIAQRLNIKSPTLARFIVQHQIWGQIEAQQAADMQQMKQEQQQEFEALMAKFNETIEGYDEQIAKYERQLEEFQ